MAARNYLFKTRHHPRFIFDEDALAVEIALATAAAPTFFEQAKVSAHSGAIYVDGGVWGNCPALAAVTEAVHFLKVSLDSIDLLRVGTLTEPASFVHEGWFRIKPGLIEWAPQLVGMMFRGQMEAAWATANLLTGAVALMMQIASIRQIELLAMLALPLRSTLHRQTQEFELPLLQAPPPQIEEN